MRIIDRPIVSRTIVALLALAMTSPLGCSDSGEVTPTPSASKSASAQSSAKPPAAPAASSAAGDEMASASSADPEALLARGRSVYMGNCIACHNADPNQEGALGPAVAGSSAELIEARVVHGTYPDGYTPKRDSKIMVPLAHLEPDIDALAVFLAP